MRQAGRVLPEYRALKEKYTFSELVKSPELAAEVTLQPMRRFGFDAAILFSDILVVPEAMGQSFQFREQGGVQMSFSLGSGRDIDRLESSAIHDRLAYATEAIRLVKAGLGGKAALIGFAGSPWTLANFMVEGGSAKEYARAKHLFYTDPKLYTQLCEKLTGAVIEFLSMQIDAGVDAVQVFDSLGGLLAGDAFERASGVWLRRIVDELKGRVPVIIFAKGAHGSLEVLSGLGAQVLGMDWTVGMGEMGRRLPERVALQGNLDPALLETTPATVAAETKVLLDEMRGRNGHIVNLGHGVPPAAKLECIESLVSTIREKQTRHEG
jgi:uroporphyrinogen decarboxylase